MRPAVIEIRKEQCGDCGCGANPSDPCASCPVGRWGAHQSCQPDEPPLPPLHVRAANLARQSAQEAMAIARGVPVPDATEIERRVSICQSNQCGMWRASDETCAACGCPMRRKTPWRSAVCPIGLWGGAM